MSDNWVVQHLMNTLDTWNEKLAEVWKLLTVSPEAFKGGGIWKVMLASLRNAMARPCTPSKAIPEMCVRGGRIA